jgi:hypothetical protein
MGGGSGGAPFLMIGATIPSYTFNNTPFEDVLRLELPTTTFASGTNKVRLTYSINCQSGLPNAEHLFVYFGLRSSTGTITNSGVFTSTNPFTIDVLPTGAGTFSATATIVDYVLVPSTAVFYIPTLYARVSSGSHTSNVSVFVSVEPYNL